MTNWVQILLILVAFTLEKDSQVFLLLGQFHPSLTELMCKHRVLLVPSSLDCMKILCLALSYCNRFYWLIQC